MAIVELNAFLQELYLIQSLPEASKSYIGEKIFKIHLAYKKQANLGLFWLHQQQLEAGAANHDHLDMSHSNGFEITMTAALVSCRTLQETDVEGTVTESPRLTDHIFDMTFSVSIIDMVKIESSKLWMQLMLVLSTSRRGMITCRSLGTYRKVPDLA